MIQQHVIGRLTVEVESNDQSTAVEYRQSLGLQLRSAHFMTALDDLLSSCDGEQTVLHIPRLEVEIDLTQENQFIPAVLEAIQKKLAVRSTPSTHQQPSRTQHLVNIALFFLEKGHFPWNAGPEQQQSVRTLLAVPAGEGTAALIAALAEKEPAEQACLWLRWVNLAGIAAMRGLLAQQYAFPESLLEVLDLLTQKSADASTLAVMRQLLAERPAPPKNLLQVLDALAQMPAAANSSSDHPHPRLAPDGVAWAKDIWVQALLHRHAPVQVETAVLQVLAAAATKPSTRPNNSFTNHFDPAMLMDAVAGLGEVQPLEASVYIQNAGLVVVWPFLTVLFQRCGLTAQGTFVSESAQETAVHLLHYLATGETNAWEDALLLPKILGGFPEEAPVSRFAPLDEHLLEEADAMLEEVICQWTVLKRTSVAGLRETFLQREGKLSRYDQHWRLQVERKAVDVLLERLPAGWGLAVVKLPWMPGLLFVEW